MTDFIEFTQTFSPKSTRCLEGVCRVSVGCLEGVWEVSGGFLGDSGYYLGGYDVNSID